MLKNVTFYQLQKNHRSIRLFLIVVSLVCISFCKKPLDAESIYISEDLQLTKLNNSSYIHTSYITLKNGVRFPCNGFIYTNTNKAYIFDSPVTDKATQELIAWLHQMQKIKIKGVVFNHFHNDCTEGIDIFKEHGILTIASNKTLEFMVDEGLLAPDQTFDQSLELPLGKKIIENTYFGEAHSKDNIVSYFPKEKILFGGCMVKSLNSKKGNLADANISEWSNTVTKIKKAYPEVEIVIPGHGDYGDQRLLEYTISLFNPNN